MADFAGFWQDQSEWSQKTFGTDAERGPKGALLHLQKEVQETLDKPDDIDEYADMQLLLFDAARRAGFTLECLYSACVRKLAVNKTRVWSKPVDDMPVEHVRE
jgi:hypothetical protein